MSICRKDWRMIFGSGNGIVPIRRPMPSSFRTQNVGSLTRGIIVIAS